MKSYCTLHSRLTLDHLTKIACIPITNKTTTAQYDKREVELEEHCPILCVLVCQFSCPDLNTAMTGVN